MKIKLDENLGRHAIDSLRKAGHDVATVPEEQLCTATDRHVIEVCRAEGRCLVTLDLDFGNPLLFHPADYPGIAVLRLPPRMQPEYLSLAVNRLIVSLAKGSIAGKLWIVEIDRVREYQPESADS